MKISLNQLRQIIKEEVSRVMCEDAAEQINSLAKMIAGNTVKLTKKSSIDPEKTDVASEWEVRFMGKQAEMNADNFEQEVNDRGQGWSVKREGPSLVVVDAQPGFKSSHFTSEF